MSPGRGEPAGAPAPAAPAWLPPWFPDLRRSPREAVTRFLGETIWRWDLARMTRRQRAGALALRMVYLVGRGFVSARAQTQAMALTYTSMLALVPAFAIIVAMFSVRGLEQARGRLETFLFDALAASPAQEQVLSEKLNELVHNVQGGGGVAGVAFLVFLVFTVVSLLSTLERTLNQVWGVTRQRSFIQKFVTYWAIMTLGPISLGTALVQGSSLWYRVWDVVGAARSSLAASPTPGPAPPPAQADPGDLDAFGLPGVTGALFDELHAGRPDVAAGGAKPDLDFILTGTVEAPSAPAGMSLPSLGLTVLTFALLYAFLPNTRVRLGPAITGAVTATALWTATKWALAASSSTLVRYDTVYGGLATIPITMFWLWLTWLIVILGAELTFAIQNIRTQGRDELATKTNALCRELIALRLVTAIAEAFDRGGAPPTHPDLAERFGAPHTLCAQLLDHLAADGLLRDVEPEGGGDPGFVPARPLDRISLADVLDSLREREGIAFDLTWGGDLPVLSEHLGRANAASKALARRVTLRDVVEALAAGDAAAAGGPGLAAGAVDAAAVSVVTARAIALASGLGVGPLRPSARLAGDRVDGGPGPSATALAEAPTQAGRAPAGATPEPGTAAPPRAEGGPAPAAPPEEAAR